MTSRQIRITLLLAIFAAAAILAVLLLNVGAVQPPKKSSGPVIGGAFELVGSDGKTVRDTDFRGRHFLVFFGYTHCPDVCPTALVSMAETFDKLTDTEREKVRGIFISVDPDRDTPALLGEFTSAFHDNIVGLTGSREQIDAAVKAYKATYRIHKGDDPEYYPVDHSSIVYLMDREGNYATHFTHRTEVDRMVAALKAELNK